MHTFAILICNLAARDHVVEGRRKLGGKVDQCRSGIDSSGDIRSKRQDLPIDSDSGHADRPIRPTGYGSPDDIALGLRRVVASEAQLRAPHLSPSEMNTEEWSSDFAGGHKVFEERRFARGGDGTERHSDEAIVGRRIEVF